MGEKISRRSLLRGLTALTIPAVTSTKLKSGELKNSDLNTQQSQSQVINKITDRFAPVDPGTVQLQGYLGERCRKNESARLLTKNEEEMLSGFQNRPGKQAWIGEHAGKWLHAATLAWAYTKSEALRAKLERVASALVAAQQEDGYLGTYADAAHWGMDKDQQWDVWVHKYDLIGLITYHNYTGDKASLEASKKIGDLLVRTFSATAESATKFDLNERSTHAGMASGSVLEPMVLLHRLTGNETYLDFARYIADHWEAEKGPKIISTLTEKKSVKLTANAKAYEMLSCLVGLCELHRTTAESVYLVPAINAWNDIVANQLLISGSGSSREHWTEPRQYLSEAKYETAETCVTVTWIQLTQQLLRLTGDARYADELEKTFYNHLAAAQKPDGSAWAYFTALDDKKPFQTEQNCCTSSGPRGWSLLPTFAYMTDNDGIVINFFTPGTATFKINGETVIVKQETSFPQHGTVSLTVTVPKPMKFALRVRIPSWSKVDGLKVKPGDYWLLRQTWSRTQTIRLDFALAVRVLPGEGSNAGKFAVARGPQVLAVDELYNPGLNNLSAIALTSRQPELKTSATYRDAEGLPVYETEATLTQDTETHKAGERILLRLVPFASAGAYGHQYAVWLRLLNSSTSSNGTQ
ncbi:MAG: glycoside hydrolase family 127 protein [Acidobacteria bacterium]|nr:glycoside hydrolase family 127 protein [Acidobacteriota bacterium]